MIVPSAVRRTALCAALLAVTVAAAAQTPLPYDRQVIATIMASDMQLEDGSFYQEWSFNATGGARIVITMRSAAFDSFLDIGRYSPAGAWESLARDDDSGGGRDAQVAFTAPTTGEYRVRANTLNSNQRGNYTMLLTNGGGGAVAATPPPAPPRPERTAPVRPTPAPRVAGPPPLPISPGDTVAGMLDETDPRAEDGSFFEDWSFTAMRGQRFLIVLRSTEFDAYLVVGTRDGGTFDLLAVDDDSGGDTDAILEFAAPADGVFVIRANSVSDGEIGEYTLQLLRTLTVR